MRFRDHVKKTRKEKQTNSWVGCNHPVSSRDRPQDYREQCLRLIPKFLENNIDTIFQNYKPNIYSIPSTKKSKFSSSYYPMFQNKIIITLSFVSFFKNISVFTPMFDRFPMHHLQSTDRAVKREPTHFSELDPKTMKVGDLRDELEARNLSSKGKSWCVHYQSSECEIDFKCLQVWSPNWSVV